MTERICCIDGCDGEAGLPGSARGMCRGHYHRWQKYGDPLSGGSPRRQGTLEERFWAKVNKDGPIPEYKPALGQCWVWTAMLRYGYGSFNTATRRNDPQGRPRGAHVVAYELLVGPVPAGLELDHLCRNRACCNPDHLEPVTHAENMARSREARECCMRGHLFDERNTRWSTRGRECRACGRDRARLRREKRKAVATFP